MVSYSAQIYLAKEPDGELMEPREEIWDQESHLRIEYNFVIDGPGITYSVYAPRHRFDVDRLVGQVEWLKANRG